MSRLFRIPLLLASVLLGTAQHASGQSDEQALRTKLLGQPLYLRGLQADDKLRFDAQGHTSSSAQAPFSLAGVTVDEVKLHGGELQLQCHRVGLVFDKGVPQRTDLVLRNGRQVKSEAIAIQVDGTPGGDFAPALDAIFTADLRDLVPGMPDVWQPFARARLLGPPAALSAGETDLPRIEPKDPPGGVLDAKEGMQPPKLAKRNEPQYSEAARNLRHQGECVVSAVVGTDGLPHDVIVVSPTGVGLDEEAVAAVRQYRFKPAMLNGTPVAVRLHIAVNFQIF